MNKYNDHLFQDTLLGLLSCGSRLNLIAPGQKFRIVRIEAAPTLSHQLVLLGLCEGSSGGLQCRSGNNGVIIEHEGRTLCLNGRQAAGIFVATVQE
jgi:Fe2+ transport system protein FeoA